MQRLALPLALALSACGGSQVSTPPLVVPTEGADAEALELPDTAPYAGLFVKGARWAFPLVTGAELPLEPSPQITCEVVAQRAYATARVGFLTCESDRELVSTGGVPFNRLLPRVGVIATATGLWFTEHLTTVTPLPDDEAGVLAWTATEPMRLAAEPAPRTATAHADADAAAGLPAIDGRLDAFALDDAWCAATENQLGTTATRWIVCLHPTRGLVGGGTALAERGIIAGALAWGQAPALPSSQPFTTPLDVEAATVRLDDPGKGKRARLTVTAAAGSTQPVAYEIATRAISDNGTGTKAEVEQPTTVLRGTAQVVAIEPSGRFRYTFTVAEATALGPRATPATVAGMETLVGAVFASEVDPDGRVAASAVTVPRPRPFTPRVLAGLTESMATFVALPSEPIAPGARWTTTVPTRIGGRDTVVTVQSKLVSRKGAVAVIASTATHPPVVSAVDGGQAQLATATTITTVLTDGRLIPTRAGEERIVATVEPTAGVANPARRERHELVRRIRILPQ
ncbi:MAG: hypothetical protein KBG48_15290 [Kofleriaceae bacterium]|jgi:hypothetical protein|nr:hypothetical protein [Kofleriaceae bacterium]MBP9168760.1 hypothetical protein [Kofleriaceae bacterium]MBP9860094.1 hypothetical protein [Kofleriaceae bacterium]